MIEFTSQNDVNHIYSTVELIDAKIPLNIEHKVIHAEEK
jgi:hypothetical protein